MTTALAPLLLLLLLACLTTYWLNRFHVGPLDTLRHLVLLRSRTLRRNHALEHATLNVLEERYGAVGLVGHAVSDGFRIVGQVDPLQLLEASNEALRRLQRGERRLAIYGRCGPSYLAAQVLVGGGSLVLLLTQRLTPLQIPLIVATAMLLAGALSRLIQRFATTATDVQGMRIDGLGLVQQYLRANLRVSEFMVRIRPRASRSHGAPYRFGERAYAHARVERGSNAPRASALA
jgi:hypothetical protein